MPIFKTNVLKAQNFLKIKCFPTSPNLYIKNHANILEFRIWKTEKGMLL